MVKKALLVGINYYSVPSARLNGCINDVVNMKAALIANYGYTENDIVILRDDTTDARYKPTAQNIVNYLYNLILASGGCEEVWFHYSGHGSQVRDTNGDEKSGYDSVIVPVDFQRVGVITDDYIYNIVKNVRSRAILLFDSCNSGTVCDLAWSYEYTSNNRFTRTQNNRFARTQNNRFAISNPNVYMISGCKDTQTSADAYDTESRTYEGAFTDAFLKALAKNGYTASLLKIYSDACIVLSAGRFSQKPILSSSSPVANLGLKKSVGVKRSLQLTNSVAAASIAEGVELAAAKETPREAAHFVESRGVLSGATDALKENFTPVKTNGFLMSSTAANKILRSAAGGGGKVRKPMLLG